MNLPDKLYKYEKFSTERLASLKDQQIYFSSPLSFNDPFDCTIGFSIKELNDEEIQTLYNYYTENHYSKDAFKEKFKSPNEEFKNSLYNGTLDAFKVSRDKMINQQGVACFSELVNEILMWSHYSDGHKGFCLEFDTKYDPFDHSMKVEYGTKLPEINIIPFVLYEDHNEMMKIFKTKYIQWSYEKEWRLFHDEAGKLYGYPAEALTGIYFGAEMPYSHIEIISLIILGQNPDVIFYQMKKDEKKYGVYFEKFTYTPYLEAKKKGLA